MATEGYSSMPGASVHENHYCSIEGCKRWGSFGFSPNKATPIIWWCCVHYPHWTVEEATRRNTRATEKVK